MNEVVLRLESQMRALKLKQMLSYYRECSERAAQGKLPYEEYLSLLLEEELPGKTEQSVKTKIHKARFPFLKTLEAFDFSFQPGLVEKGGSEAQKSGFY
ncbi:MAG: ATP-binding protein [Desulfobacterota bacterium]|nr:ATP-binding protein [Thermodesulfobacteriota bacterium]